MRTALAFVGLLPRNTLIALLKIYKRTISPLYGQVCRYYPTCSSYALTAVQQHGALRGGLLAARRLSRCHPWSAGGIDDVPIRGVGVSLTRLGFVNWQTAGDHRTTD